MRALVSKVAPGAMRKVIGYCRMMVPLRNVPWHSRTTTPCRAQSSMTRWMVAVSTRSLASVPRARPDNGVIRMFDHRVRRQNKSFRRSFLKGSVRLRDAGKRLRNPRADPRGRPDSPFMRFLKIARAQLR